MTRAWTHYLGLSLRLGAVLIAAYQLAMIGQAAFQLISTKIRPNSGLDAVSRSADVSYGHQFLDNITALRSEIPEDAAVAITGSSDLAQYRATDFLQYFLFPRQVKRLSCQAELTFEACLNAELREGAHVIATESEWATAEGTVEGQFRRLHADLVLISPVSDD